MNEIICLIMNMIKYDFPAICGTSVRNFETAKT